MDKYNCPISEMSKNFPEKINVVTIKYFYALHVFLFLFFCYHKKKIKFDKKYLGIFTCSKYIETNDGKNCQKMPKFYL